MAIPKLKRTLEEAREYIKENKELFPSAAQREYCHRMDVPHSNLYRYLKGEIPSAIVANNLADFMEDYIEKNRKAA